MVFKVEDSELYISTKGIFKTILCIHIFVKLHKAVVHAKHKYYEALNEQLKEAKEKNKMSKKEKVESK